MKLLANTAEMAFIVQSISFTIKETFTITRGHSATFMILAAVLTVGTLQTTGIGLPSEKR